MSCIYGENGISNSIFGKQLNADIRNFGINFVYIIVEKYYLICNL